MPLCTGLHLCAASAPPLRRLCAASAASALRRRGDAYPNPEPNPNPNQAWRSPPKMAALSSSCLPASGCSSRSRSSRWRSPTSEAVSCLGPWSLVLGPWSLVLGPSSIYRRRVAACRGWGCAHSLWLPRCVAPRRMPPELLVLLFRESFSACTRACRCCASCVSCGVCPC